MNGPLPTEAVVVSYLDHSGYAHLMMSQMWKHMDFARRLSAEWMAAHGYDRYGRDQPTEMRP